MRSTAQMISYEVFIGLLFIIVLLYSGSLNLVNIIYSQKDLPYVIPLFPVSVIFFISILAETNRAPFDLPEAETELTAGFHTEYSGLKFALFFLGEYLSVTLISAMTVTLFFGGWVGPDFLPPLFWFLFKVFILIMFFILLRTSLPRPRFDQLMSFGWKVMLPLTLFNLILTAALKLGGFYG